MIVFIFLLSVFILIVINVSSTIIAVKCLDGIVIASDSQTSSSTASSSPFISNRFLRKLFLLNPSTAICCAAGDSDFLQLYEKLKIEVKREEMIGEEMMVSNRVYKRRSIDTKAIYHLARKQIHKKFPLAHAIVAGYDPVSISTSKGLIKRNQYRLFEVLPGGTGIEQQVAVSGSGASTAVSLLGEVLNPEKLETIVTSEAVQVLSRVFSAIMGVDRKTGGDLNIWILSETESKQKEE